MAGHSHWAGIKHKKGITDQKRGRAFSKLLSLISAAAKTEPNPDFNPRLRTVVDKAKEANVPNDKIENAIARAREQGEKIEELICEAYGPGGAAILIEAISDNKNKTVSEIKKIIGDEGGKWAETNSVKWAFEQTPRKHDPEVNWTAKFQCELGAEDAAQLRALVEALEEHDDVQAVHSNMKNRNNE